MTTRHPRFALILAAATLAGCARHSGSGPNLGSSVVPRFETRIEVPTGITAHSDMVVADLNNDGVLDMAVIGLGGDLQVLIGTGGGTFAPGQHLNLGGGPIWIAGKDLDGDGDVDLVVVRSVDDRTTVLTNDGTGTYTVTHDLPVGQDALAVAIGDANNDGIDDILVSRPVAPQIVVYTGDGHGNFLANDPVTLPGGGSSYTITVADVTGDQVADLVVSDPALQRVLVFRGQGGGGGKTDFDSVPLELEVSGDPRYVAVGDANSDGRPDLVVSTTGAPRFVVITGFDGNAPGGVTPYTSFEVPVEGTPSISVIDDVTGDGLPDIVACVMPRASMVVFPQQPGGTYGPSFQLDAAGLPLRPHVGDVDGNHKKDLLVLSGLGDRINLWLADGAGRLVGARNYATGIQAAVVVAAADFDGDGKGDAVVAGDAARVQFLTPDAEGRPQVSASIPVGLRALNVKVVDLDADGKPDLVVPVVGGVKILRNRSTPGNFAFDVLPDAGSGVLVSGNGPFGVATGDLDRDGSIDVAVCDFHDGTVTLLLGTAQPFVFQGQPRVTNVGGGPIDIVAGDFTGDGILDLALSRASLSDILVLRNDGHANLSQFVSVPVGTAPNYLVTADFNGDGRADLVVSNGNSASVTVLFGDPAGFRSANFPAGQSPTALLAQDLTGDGVPDILVASLVGGDFRIMVGDGVGGFPGLFAFPGTLGATGATLQDLDGDRKPDLLITSLISSRMSVVRNITVPALSAARIARQ